MFKTTTIMYVNFSNGIVTPRNCTTVAYNAGYTTKRAQPTASEPLDCGAMNSDLASLEYQSSVLITIDAGHKPSPSPPPDNDRFGNNAMCLSVSRTSES